MTTETSNPFGQYGNLVHLMLGHYVEPTDYTTETWFHFPNAVYLAPFIKDAGWFWANLMNHYQRHKILHALFYIDSLDLLCTTQHYHEYCMVEFPICFFREYPHAIIYVPRILNKTTLFKENFRPLGKITTMG